MADPKAQARAAQEAADRAKAAAKDMAVAAAKAEAKAESQAATSAAPIAGSAAGLAATGIAAKVPLDASAQGTATRTVERSAETGTRDLGNEEQRMADSRVAGIASGRKTGETDAPDRAKDAAVAPARAEAKAEPQAISAAPIAGTAAGAAATGIAANVPLDVFTQGTATRTVERPAETGTRDLGNEEQRMADSRGSGIAGAASGRKTGETDAPDRAKAAAKDAAVAAARAEAKAESQAATSAAPIAGSAAGLAATGIAANVPLDVFIQGTSAPRVERPTESGAKDLSNEEQRMADSPGAGIANAASGKKIGESEDPDLGSRQRPGVAERPTGPGDFADNPLGDRSAAFRDGPEGESENPLDSFGKLNDRGADLLAAAGQGGGLNAMADRLHAGPQSGQGQGLGKEAIATGNQFLESMKGWRVQPPPPSEATVFEDGSMTWENSDGSTTIMDTDGNVVTVTTETASGAPAEEYIILPPDPPRSGGGVKNPGPQGETALPPGWIGGDAILPPGLRTGAVVGGAKGNDGVDWASQRWGTSNPDPNEGGGGGRPSAGAVWRQAQTNESLVGQPAGDPKDADGGGGGSGFSWAERQNRVSNPTGTDQDPAYGKGPEESEAVSTDPNQGNLSHLWASSDEDDDVSRASIRLTTVRSEDADDDN